VTGLRGWKPRTSISGAVEGASMAISLHESLAAIPNPYARARELPSLAPSEFELFFEQVHGMPPFPWQSRLAEEVMKTGHWPKRLRLPPGSGSSGLITIAVFHLAREADLGEGRRAPMRIVPVLDRLCASNAMFDHACRLDKALRTGSSDRADEGVLGKVAHRLAYLSGSARPLVVRMLFHGAPQEGDWTPTASQPTVVCSTVDQVGSRLLFRGYGTSDAMKPVHAGLLGADCLLLLDQIHFSEAFRETLGCVDDYRHWCERGTAPWMYVNLQGASCSNTTHSFGLTEADYQHPVLARRFGAEKRTHLVRSANSLKSTFGHATELVRYAWLLSGLETGARGRIVAIIVNTIGLARACQEVLSRRLGPSSDARTLLLIGRSRPFDRERLMRTEGAALASGLGSTDPVLFVIATQSLEAGPDVSFDALVSQIASIDALRLRFARLNRRGGAVSSEAVIVACRDETGSLATDPIYGTAAKATWDWLVENASRPTKADKKRVQGVQRTINFATAAMNAKLALADTAYLIAPQYPAPTLMWTYVDLWSDTSPVPTADAEVGLFLHGTPDAADVLIIWRDDVDLSTTPAVARSHRALQQCPPRAQEGIPVPICAARAWLLRRTILPTADVEGAWSVEYFRATPPPVGRPALRWAGPSEDSSPCVFADELRPGDILVVPSSYGGADEAGWYPNSYELRFTDPSVRDLSEELIAAGGAQSTAFRMHPALLEAAASVENDRDSRYVRTADAVWRDVWDTVLAAGPEPDAAGLAGSLLRVDGMPTPWIRRLRRAANSKDVTVRAPRDETDGYGSGVIFVDLGSPGHRREIEVAYQPSTTEDHAPLFRVVPVTVDDYQRRFEMYVQAVAPHVVFPEILMPDLALAAWLSGEGLRDVRYQAFLRGGDRMALSGDFVALATCTTLFDIPYAAIRVRERINLPEHWRPEAEAVMRALAHPRLAEARDKFLVVWLVGTLHGFGRPFFPHSDPEHAGPQDLDVVIDGHDWSQIFTALKERYGWWGLAQLEATVRLCEHQFWNAG
jgi:CRISPR-associated endonuclease/helicase Cas3